MSIHHGDWHHDRLNAEEYENTKGEAKLASESKGAPAPTQWMKQLEIAIRTTKFHREEFPVDCGLPREVADQIMEIIVAHCQAPAPVDKYVQMAEMLREMATEKPDIKLWVAASVLLGGLIKPTEADIRRGQEIAENLVGAATPQGAHCQAPAPAAQWIKPNFPAATPEEWNALAPQGPPPTPDKCGNEFQLKHGYFCELPMGHAGDHEAECPNPQFHQSWSQALPDKCPTCGSPIRKLKLNRLTKPSYSLCTDPWHSSAATQKDSK